MAQGRYKWRHDLVIREVAHKIDLKKKEKTEKSREAKSNIMFVKAGEKARGGTT